MSKPKLTPDKVKETQRLRDAGIPSKEIAERFGISEALVSVKTSPKEPEEYNWQKKANWPEWSLWDNLHRRYGKKTAAGG